MLNSIWVIFTFSGHFRLSFVSFHLSISLYILMSLILNYNIDIVLCMTGVVYFENWYVFFSFIFTKIIFYLYMSKMFHAIFVVLQYFSFQIPYSKKIDFFVIKNKYYIYLLYWLSRRKQISFLIFDSSTVKKLSLSLGWKNVYSHVRDRDRGSIPIRDK